MGPRRRCPPPGPAHREPRPTSPSLHEAVAALVGPQFRHLGFEAQPGEGRAHADAAVAGHQPPGYRRRRPRRARRGGCAGSIASPLGGGNGEPIPADVEAATLAVVAQLAPARRLRRPAASATATASTPQEEMRSLNALSRLPGHRPGPAHLRSGHDRGAEPERVDRHRRRCWPTRWPGQAIWRRITEAWDAILERFPKNAHARIAEAIPALCGDAGFAPHGGAVPGRPSPGVGTPPCRPVGGAPGRQRRLCRPRARPVGRQLAGLPSPPPRQLEPRTESHPARPAR